MKHNIYKFLSLAFMFMACVTFVGTTAYAEDYPANPTTKEGYGEVPTTWWSAQWTESEVDGYTRLINRWQPDYSIHTEDYQWLIQYGNVPTTYWTSQWRFIQAN